MPFSSRVDDLRLHLGDLFLEFSEHFGGVHRVDEDGNVEHPVHVDDRREPAVGEEARIRHHEECARDLLAQVEFARSDLERERRDDVLQLENALLVDLLGQDGRDGARRSFLILRNREVPYDCLLGYPA